MSHGDKVTGGAGAFEVLARSDNSEIAAFHYPPRNVYAVQFHPEVQHTAYGDTIIENFVFGVCDCEASWSTGAIVDQMIADIRERVGDSRVICAVGEALQLMFSATRVAQILGVTDERNQPSIRLLERLGFEFIESHRVDFRGEPCTERVYALPRGDG